MPRMSLIYHPDKIRPDPAKNETVEMLNERFVELTKAGDGFLIRALFSKLVGLRSSERIGQARPDLYNSPSRPAKNETVEMLNERFVELTKAYKALTDEEVRNNYLQFAVPPLADDIGQQNTQKSTVHH
jgi:preprotein translocase subunit Sec63